MPCATAPSVALNFSKTVVVLRSELNPSSIRAPWGSASRAELALGLPIVRGVSCSRATFH